MYLVDGHARRQSYAAHHVNKTGGESGALSAYWKRKEGGELPKTLFAECLRMEGGLQSVPFCSDRLENQLRMPRARLSRGVSTKYLARTCQDLT